MARINSYQNDGTITGGDKWLGTDQADGSVKNFTVDAIAQYFASTGVADPSRLGFSFEYGGIWSNQSVAPGTFYYELDPLANGSLTHSTIRAIIVSDTTNRGVSMDGVVPIMDDSILKITGVRTSEDTDYGYYSVSAVSPLTNGYYRIQVQFTQNAGTGAVAQGTTVFTVQGSVNVTSAILEGNGIFHGTGDPVDVAPNPEDGNFYIRYSGTVQNPTNYRIYGPSLAGQWGNPTDLRGEKGDTGDPGPTGPRGFPGTNGRDGVDGRDGIDGVNGMDGRDGAPGMNGVDGADGTDGVDGQQGPQGLFVIEAYAGSSTAVTQAPSGGTFSGGQLTAAPTGTGATWRTTVAAAVADGGDFYISRATYDPADNTISAWSVPYLSSGTAGPSGPRGQQGLPGNDGAPGAPGAQGPGYNAGSYDSSSGVITFTGTNGASDFMTGDLRGPAGTPGTNGTNGVDGRNGSDGRDGSDGSDGAPGADGIDGESITVVTQIENDMSGNAQVQLGTVSNPILNTITIPRGPAGMDGTNGMDGSDGASITITMNEVNSEGGRDLTFSDGSTVTIDRGPQGETGVTDLTSFTTDDLSEGTNADRRYYTDARGTSLIEDNVYVWARSSDTSTPVPNTKLPNSATYLPAEFQAGDAGKVPAVNTGLSGYELIEALSRDDEGNITSGDTGLTTDNLPGTTARPYATQGNVQSVLGIDGSNSEYSDVFLNRQGAWTTASVSDDRIDTRVELITEPWAQRVENAVGNYVPDNTVRIPEEKLPVGAVTSQQSFNLLTTESNTHQVPNQVA